MHRGFTGWTAGLCAAVALTLIPVDCAVAQTANQPVVAKTVKSKKKPVAARAPRPAPSRNGGEMTPGTGPALLRGVKDDNM